MPTYDYKCEKCGHEFERQLSIAKMNEPTEYPCPCGSCHGKIKKIIVKASGFAYDNIRTRHSTNKVPSWHTDQMKELKHSKGLPHNTL